MADKRVRLTWQGKGLEFAGSGENTPETLIDGDSGTGPGPMDMLLLATCGCMGADICMILDKSRVSFDGLEILAEGDRAENPPRRYTAIRMVCVVTGADPADEAKVERAVRLSRETYCSVLHSLRDDIALDISHRLD